MFLTPSIFKRLRARPNSGELMSKNTAFMSKGRWIVSFASLLLVACTSRAPEPHLPQMGLVDPPEINIDPATGRHSTEIEVLIYNIAALPWPFLSNRTEAIRLIGRDLREMRNAGTAPDIVLVQESFRRSSKYLVELSGYPNWVEGPTTGDRTPGYSDRAPEKFRRERSFWKGEKFGKVMNSGLMAMSNWPITAKKAQPFFRYECAGFDCGANKGMLLIDVKIPGLPGPLHIITSHMNADGATAKVPDERALAAHHLQIDHMVEVVADTWTKEYPLIFGGDFNMKHAKDRLDYAVAEVDKPFYEVTYWCSRPGHTCDVRMSYDSDHPWLDTQDLQGWLPGGHIDIEPVMVEALFDEPDPDAPMIRGRKTLSDHDGFLVRYRLSWNP